MKVLLGVATYPITAATPNAVYPATRAAIDALEFDGDVAIDLFDGDDPTLSMFDNLTNKHNQMRERALNLDYDALLTVEGDIIIPPDALTQLAAVDASIVYAAYCSRTQPMVLTFPTINGYRGRSISADADQWRGKFCSVIACEGVGFGCTLIHRDVLEAIEFRRDTSTAMRRKFADDWTFALDVKDAGFKSAAHLGVLCGHIQRDGALRWVDADMPDFTRVEGAIAPAAATLPPSAQYRCRKTLFGQVNTYAPGALIELRANDAAILLGLGKIEII